MTETIKLLDVVALSRLTCPNTTSGAVKWAPWLTSWRVALPMKLNSATGTAGLTNPSVCAPTRSWYCATNR